MNEKLDKIKQAYIEGEATKLVTEASLLLLGWPVYLIKDVIGLWTYTKERKNRK